MYFLVYNFSTFHLDGLRGKIMGVYCKGSRSIESNRILILCQQLRCQFPRCLYCARRVLSTQLTQNLCVFCPDCLFTQILASNINPEFMVKIKIGCTSDAMIVPEGILLNHRIVLQWEINEIASWMIFKNSEEQNFSRRINAELKYFVVSPSSSVLVHFSSDQF